MYSGNEWFPFDVIDFKIIVIRVRLPSFWNETQNALIEKWIENGMMAFDQTTSNRLMKRMHQFS